MSRMKIVRSGFSLSLALAGAITGFQSSVPLFAQEPAATDSELKLVVLQGEDGANIIKKKTAVMPIVEVRDKNNAPVAGATVLFTLPSSGSSATFAHGAKTLSLVTDSAGRAAVTGMKPVGTGAFKIGVSASFHGQVASATITQTNYATIAAAHAAGVTTGAASGTGAGISTGAIIGIIAGVGAAAGIGAAVAGKGGSKNTPISIPHGTIGSGGGPTLGPPH